jgi:topoisomerase-4 subunit A
VAKKKLLSLKFLTSLTKLSLVKKIDDVRVNAKVAGIAEVRDRSDRDGLRIAIELRKDADAELILNYLLKYTDLQVNYNFNMVAIDNATPRQVGILPILSSYISHKRDIIRSRSIFDRDKAEKRLHIVEGLIRVLVFWMKSLPSSVPTDNKADARELDGILQL